MKDGVILKAYQEFQLVSSTSPLIPLNPFSYLSPIVTLAEGVICRLQVAGIIIIQ